MRNVFRPLAVVTVALLAASGCAFPTATSVKQDPGVSQQADQALAAAAAKQKDTEAGRTRLSSSLAALQGERDRLRSELERERGEGGTLRRTLEETQARLADAETRAADQRRTTLALRGLLERSVQSLADNERQNRTLYDLGHRAVADYQACQEHGSSSPDGNLLGLGSVRTTSVAEQLRREMDAVAAPATLARPASAPAPAPMIAPPWSTVARSRARASSPVTRAARPAWPPSPRRTPRR